MFVFCDGIHPRYVTVSLIGQSLHSLCVHITSVNSIKNTFFRFSAICVSDNYCWCVCVCVCCNTCLM